MSTTTEHTDYHVDHDRILPENYGQRGEPPVYFDSPVVSKHKCKLQVVQICFAALIFYQAYYMHYGSLNFNNLSVTDPMEIFGPLCYYTLGYVLNIVYVGKWAADYQPQRILNAGMVLNGVLHCIYSIMIHFLPYEFYYYRMAPNLLYKAWHVLHGACNALMLPSAYTILARNVPMRYRATVGSLVLSMKWFILPFSWLISAGSYNSAFVVFAFISCTLGVIYIAVPCETGPYVFVDQRTASYKPPVPWRAMFKSLPVWTLIAAHSVYFVTQFYSPLGQTMIVDFHSTLDIRYLQLDRIISELPRFIMAVVCTLGAGCFSDWLVKRSHLTRDRARKIFHFFGAAVPTAGLLVLQVIDASIYHTFATHNFFAGCLMVLHGFACIQASGFLINHMDLSPYYAGVLIAISEAANQVVMCLLIWIFSSYQSQAMIIIKMVGVPIVCVFASFFFLICARADIQDWSPIPFSLFQSRQPSYVGPRRNPFISSNL